MPCIGQHAACLCMMMRTRCAMDSRILHRTTVFELLAGAQAQGLQAMHDSHGVDAPRLQAHALQIEACCVDRERWQAGAGEAWAVSQRNTLHVAVMICNVLSKT